MQIGKPSVPLRLNIDPLSGAAKPHTVEQTLSRKLRAAMSQRAFQQEQATSSASARTQLSQEARAGLLQQISQQFAQLQTGFGSLLLTQAVSRLEGAGTVASAGTRSATSSGDRLNLGAATGPTSQTLSTIDRTQLLSLQPLTTPITKGSASFDLSLNGTTQSISVAVDPTKDTLDGVLQRLQSQLGTKATVSYDASTNQMRLSASKSGDELMLEQTSASTNFFQVMFGTNQQRTVSATAGAAITNSSVVAQYNDLEISFQGDLYRLGNLKVSSLTASADTKATELASQINTQLAGLGTSLRASAASGKLSFYDSSSTSQNLIETGLSFSEIQGTTTVASVTKGKGKGKGKGNGNGNGNGNGKNTTYSTLSLGLENAATAISYSVTGKPALAANTLLGPNAQLKSLAPQLGLTAQNGRYTIAINGTQLSFNENETLMDVLGGINRSSAGVNATYDEAGKRVVLTSKQVGDEVVRVQDVSGNLAGRLGLNSAARTRQGRDAVEAGRSVTETALTADGTAHLQALGDQLNQVLGLLNTATAAKGPFRNDELLNNLKDALSGLFAPAASQGFNSLSDLGFKLEAGHVSFDASKLQGLSSEQLDQANRFLGAFVGERLQPLLKSGMQAMANDQAISPHAREAAHQAVGLHASISRMQNRQLLLLHHEVANKKQASALEEQDDLLRKAQNKLNPKLNEAEEQDEKKPLAPKNDERLPLAPLPAPGAPSPAINSMPTGLGSFGLSS